MATKKPNSKITPSAIAVVDNIVFSKSSQTAFYRLTNDVYDFLSNQGKVSASLQISNAFTSLMTDRKESLDVSLHVLSVPVDIDAWEAQVRETSKSWAKSPGFEQYLQDQINYLRQEEYLKKEVILGVDLGKRGALDMGDINPFEVGFKGALDLVKKWGAKALAVPSENVTAAEEKAARSKEKDFFRTLSVGHLGAERISSEDILLMIKRQFYPAMPAPYLDVDYESRLGAGDLITELGGVVENKYRWLKISQMLGDQEVVGYRATMSFSKFPRFTSYPAGTFPFMYFPARLSLPFTLYARLTLHPSEKMKAQLKAKEKEASDELENASAGQTNTSAALSGGLPGDVASNVQDIQMMNELLSNDKTPWVEGSYRIVIETHSEESLRRFCSTVRQRYADLDIQVNWTAGDQALLFLEQMPGDHTRINSFKQVTSMSFLSSSGFRASSDIGDLIIRPEGKH